VTPIAAVPKHLLVKRDMLHCVLLKLDFIATKIGGVLLFPRTRARSDATAAMFALILQPLVDSGHIGAKEVGKLA
jgi:hypothetical protein